MYVIDLRQFLDEKGAIAVPAGPGRRLADFVTAVVAHACASEDPDDSHSPRCFKCRKSDNRRVQTGFAEDLRIAWHCPACGTHGLISNWEGSFWDLGQDSGSH